MKPKVKGATAQKKKPSIRIADRRGRFLHRHSASDALAGIRADYYEKKARKKK